MNATDEASLNEPQIGGSGNERLIYANNEVRFIIAEGCNNIRSLKFRLGWASNYWRFKLMGCRAEGVIQKPRFLSKHEPRRKLFSR